MPGAVPDDDAAGDEAGYGTGEWAAGHGEDGWAPAPRTGEWAADHGEDEWAADHGEDDDDDAVHGEDEWVADHTTQGHGAASRGPARGFPPAPGQPDPVYPHNDRDAWSDSADAPQGQWDSPAAAGAWDAAPVGQSASTAQQGGHWDGDGHLDQGGHWGQEDDAAPQPWGEGSGQWDAPYGQWDEHGEWHSPQEDGEWRGPDEQDSGDGSGHETGTHHADGYDRADFAIAGRDADRWESADYPAHGGYPDAPGPGGEENGGQRKRHRRGGHGRTGTATPAADAGHVGAGGRGPGAAARRVARGSRTTAIVTATAAVVVVAAIAAVAFVLLTRHSRPSTAAAGASVPKLPSPTASGSLGTSGASRLGKWGYITSRATDAAPLTVAELYPAQFLINGSSFVRTTDRADTGCNQALFGTKLQNAAKVYGCSQVVRASYISGSQTMMGTIGVVNLSSANDAAKAGNASGANDFVTPLDGKAGPTRNLSQGTGVVQAEYKGHYLILIWAEFANLKAPSAEAQRTQLEQFASGLISGSANIALSNRMVSGHPEVTGTPG